MSQCSVEHQVNAVNVERKNKWNFWFVVWMDWIVDRWYGVVDAKQFPSCHKFTTEKCDIKFGSGAQALISTIFGFDMVMPMNAPTSTFSSTLRATTVLDLSLN